MVTHAFAHLHLSIGIVFAGGPVSQRAVTLIRSSYTLAKTKMAKSIHDLPTDILLLIFRSCTSRPLEQDVDHPPSWSVLPLCNGRTFSDTEAPEYCLASEQPDSHFPQGLTHVCRLWRDVIRAVSSFWIRLVIWIGWNPTPLLKIRRHLACSRDRPIDIFLLRRFDPRMEDSTEKAQVKDALRILLPHMKRWRSFIASLLHSSSLPCPRFELTGSADLLQVLHLDFVSDDSVALGRARSKVERPFETPALKRLSMGGLHFHEVYAKRFPQTALPAGLAELTIREYGTRHPRFPLVQLLRCILPCAELKQLTLANLELFCDYSDDLSLVSKTMRPWSADLHFFDMNMKVIYEVNWLLYFPDLECVSYTRCFAPEPEPVAPSASVVYMESIADSTIIWQVVREAGIHRCALSELYISNCDGLTDDVLHALGKPLLSEEEEPGEQWASRNLWSIHFEGCTNISSAVVRQLVQARGVANAATGLTNYWQPGFNVMPVDMLDVYDCCALADEDKKWFEENPMQLFAWDDIYWDDVNWNGHAPGTSQPREEAS